MPRTSICPLKSVSFDVGEPNFTHIKRLSGKPYNQFGWKPGLSDHSLPGISGFPFHPGIAMRRADSIAGDAGVEVSYPRHLCGFVDGNHSLAYGRSCRVWGSRRRNLLIHRKSATHQIIPKVEHQCFADPGVCVIAGDISDVFA